ncbi:outer membrane protein assembly factor BamD [Candidatus Xenohaliotis californiensis]|uniref:Outer membrane protein assembly factor BamD n=1 Tax=Candidatus Xenohaliotis californiensis TaxID=84677 RepID=A0ABM9N800_9RICK|nr:outer membrane protein assembly factor BamD [Candidatus Xenohaliotis californiensis]
MKIKIFALIVLIISISSNSCLAVRKQQVISKPPELLYANGIKQIKEHSKNTKSIEIFKNLMVSYPFSNYSLKGQIVSAYIHYKNREYQDAYTAAQNYINNYPGGQYSLYALYLMALASFHNAIINSTDISMLSKAKLELEYLYNKDQNGIYINDIKQRLKIINQLTANQIIEIGLFYFKKQKYQATINRMQDIVNQYPDSKNVTTALQYIIISYKNLGFNDRAEVYTNILYKRYTKKNNNMQNNNN